MDKELAKYRPELALNQTR